MQRLICLLTVFIPFISIAQPLPLTDSLWQFRQGDDPAWADPSHPDGDWLKVPIGQTWEAFLQKDYDGLAWYRRRIEVPEGFEAEARFNGGLVLSLGQI